MSERQYGEQFENTIVAIMSAIIVLSLIGVTMLIKTYTPECKASYQTYCGEASDHHADPH